MWDRKKIFERLIGYIIFMPDTNNFLKNLISKNWILISCVLFGGLFYFLFFSYFDVSPHPILNSKIKYENDINVNDLVTILLTAVTVVLTAVAVIITLLAIWGYKNIKKESIDKSSEKSIERVENSMREGGELHKLLTSRIKTEFTEYAPIQDYIDGIVSRAVETKIEEHNAKFEENIYDAIMENVEDKITEHDSIIDNKIAKAIEERHHDGNIDY